MLKRLFFFVFICLSFLQTSVAQNTQKFTISGTVKDLKTGETLIGASVTISELSGVGTTTNEYGFYSLTLPRGTYNVNVTYVGYLNFKEKIVLEKDERRDLIVTDDAKMLQEVVVSDKKKDDNVTRAQMGVQKLDVKEINNVPVLFGEKDILKTIQLLPGIKSAGEGNSGFYVRGGGSDQNLILLDEAPVYNASHLLGFFSTFNSDAIKDATIYKGGMPAQYGGRLSSVLDIRMNDGNNQRYGVSGGIGLIASRLNIEGPLVKDESSFLISGRRTYADQFLRFSSDKTLKDNTLYFYDLNAKTNFKINEKNRIFLSGYFGRDVLGFGTQFGFDWGNATGTLRWNHIVNQKLFSNTSLIYSDYNYGIKITSNDTKFTIASGIRDWNIKQEFQYFANPDNNWRFGFNSIYHTVSPNAITSDGTNINSSKDPNRLGWENALYVTNDLKVNPNLNITYGLRLTSFSVLGNGNAFSIYDSKGNATTTKTYNNGEIAKTYVNIEPRLSSSYRLDEVSSLKASYARNVQNMHLLSNSTSSNPTDLWIPSSLNVKPELSDQVSLGYFRNFDDNKYEFSVETYYKTLSNQVDYKDGADVTGNPNVENQLLYGKGRAYGVEFFLKKKFGRLNGWVGYTLSRVEKQIDGINNSQWYAARQDRTHDISIVGIYELTPRWTVSGTWVYNTGNAITFPSGKYDLNGKTVFYYTERNGYRMPNYHRLDLGATYIKKKTAKFESSWNFSIYNAYARENAYTITFRTSETDPTKTEAVRTALFKMIPSVTYNFKW